MPVAELLERCSASELLHWEEFAKMEPFGGVVDDLRAGLAPAATINANRDPEKGKPIGPLDFYPWHDKAEKVKAPETPEERAAAIRALLEGKSKGEG